jgi:hypothetical protein
MQRSSLGRVSVLINELTGGRKGESLCARLARTRGSNCTTCRAVGFLLRDQFHCLDELIHQLKKERKL